ncbi:hypothetical protein ACROAE_19710, partial [Shewanella sp. MF05960]|uniref:hypothetical protein n=1 Tax=Shewanella sp. MF05960 TaxID=3434874 RepID=UPI003D78BD7C
LDKLLKSVDRFSRSGLRILRIPFMASSVFSNFFLPLSLPPQWFDNTHRLLLSLSAVSVDAHYRQLKI